MDEKTHCLSCGDAFVDTAALKNHENAKSDRTCRERKDAKLRKLADRLFPIVRYWEIQEDTANEDDHYSLTFTTDIGNFELTRIYSRTYKDLDKDLVGQKQRGHIAYQKRKKSSSSEQETSSPENPIFGYVTCRAKGCVKPRSTSRGADNSYCSNHQSTDE